MRSRGALGVFDGLQSTVLCLTGGAYRISRIFTASSGFVSYINIVLFFFAISTWWPPLLHSVTLLYTSWRPQISPEHVPMYVNLPALSYTVAGPDAETNSHI